MASRERLDHQDQRGTKEPRVRMDPTELLDPLELQENKAFLVYLVARVRLEILERRAHQGRLVSPGRLVYLAPRVVMVGLELQDQRDLREIRVTQDQMGLQDLLALKDPRVILGHLASREHQGSRALEASRESLDSLENMARKETEECKGVLGPLVCLASWVLLKSLE